MSALAPITVAEIMPTNPIDDPEAPLIGVIAPLHYPDIGEEIRALIVRFTHSVLSTLTELGARFRVIEPTSEAPLPLDAAIDGVLLLGGGDMIPRSTDTTTTFRTCRGSTGAATSAPSKPFAGDWTTADLCSGYAEEPKPSTSLTAAPSSPTWAPTAPTEVTATARPSSTTPSSSKQARASPKSSDAPSHRAKRPPPGRR